MTWQLNECNKSKKASEVPKIALFIIYKKTPYKHG